MSVLIMFFFLLFFLATLSFPVVTEYIYYIATYDRNEEELKKCKELLKEHGIKVED